MERAYRLEVNMNDIIVGGTYESKIEETGRAIVTRVTDDFVYYEYTNIEAGLKGDLNRPKFEFLEYYKLVYIVEGFEV